MQSYNGVRAELVLDTGAWLEKALADSKERFIVASPYIKAVLPALFRRARGDRHCLTTLQLGPGPNRSTDLAALSTLQEQAVQLYQVPGLHAKVYVVDSVALVTSANATNAGLRSNKECGVALHSNEAADTLAQLVKSGFNAPRGAHRLLLPEDIIRHRKLLGSLRPIVPVIPAEPEEAVAEVLKDPQALLDATSGWLRLTLEGVLELPQRFKLVDVYDRCLERSQLEYEQNRHRKAKLRQQLQILRAHGLVEFFGNGHYQRTFLLGEEA